ncbi:MAG: alpha-amylase family glycosyl hydrolase [Oscillospiraceae bacterium]
MFDKLTFDSRNAKCKKPFGAVASGKKVTLNLYPLRSEGVSQGTVTARLEMAGDEKRTFPLEWTDFCGSRDTFSATVETGDYVGLLWYSFTLTGLDGRQCQSEEYQLTVYDGKALPVPAWFGEGMCYQIFPDRFRRTALPDPAGMVGGRTIHTQWKDEPEYLPNANGEIRNRDFFGGNLAGVMEKLPYLAGLGVETLYFCPIFEAAENHRYGTADYEKIDPMLGTEEDFVRMCAKAHKLGMRVMLDGVFNHVGYVSRYFNGDGFYGKVGAAQDKKSPFFPWFRFTKWPTKYEAWWDFYTLPDVQEDEESYREYIISGEESIIKRWLRLGADGWRLDVADELPDDFIAQLDTAAKSVNPQAVVVGEVWEDGTTKVAYGVRRRHVLGGHCDGLMNYPLRTALIAYLTGGDAAQFEETMETLREHYPRDNFYASMNTLGTHDTPRALTVLGVGSDCKEQSKAWRAEYRMTPEERQRGLVRLKMGLAALFAFPGAPMVYYADEAGLEGFEDPFNRRSYPWRKENKGLVQYVRALGNLRKNHPALRSGTISYLTAEGPLLCFSRETKGERIAAALNNGAEAAEVTLPWRKCTDLLSGEVFSGGTVPLGGMTARLLRKG